MSATASSGKNDDQGCTICCDPVSGCALSQMKAELNYRNYPWDIIGAPGVNPGFRPSKEGYPLYPAPVMMAGIPMPAPQMAPTYIMAGAPPNGMYPNPQPYPQQAQPQPGYVYQQHQQPQQRYA